MSFLKSRTTDPSPPTPSYSSAPSPPPHPPPLLSLDDLTQHLHLLRHFHLLEQRIRSTSTGLLSALSPFERWSTFLRLGTLRLEVWVTFFAFLSTNTQGERLSWEDKVLAVPEDAVVCWYAWAISGGRGRYEEDCLRGAWEVMTRTVAGGEGRVAKDFPVDLLLRRLNDPALLDRGKSLWSSILFTAAQQNKPSLAALAAWDATTVLAVPTGVEVECPWEGCGVQQAILLLTGARTGYAEAAFSQLCSACRKPITRPALGLKKLIDIDLRKQLIVPKRAKDEHEAERMRWEKVQAGDRGRRRDVQGLLAATLAITTDCSLPHLCPLYTPTSSPSHLSGSAYTSAIQIRVEVEGALHPILRGRKGGRGVPVALDSLEKVMKVVDEGTGLPKRLITHLLTAYTTPSSLFSTDIALSALRLSELTIQIAGLGWLEKGWAERQEAQAVLREAEGRYEKFLALASKIAGKEGAPLVPPVDVDFVWHTHLLMASQYRRDIAQHYGFYIPHHDAVEESLAATQWEKGRKVWEEKYHTALCTLPCYASSPSSTKTGKINRFFASSSSPLPSTSSLLVSPTPALLYPPKSTAPSTHASILVHRAKQDQRRRKRKEGEEPFFLRTATGEEGKPELGERGVWVVKEEEARGGSEIVGVDGYSPPSAWSIPFTHPSSYDPDQPVYSGSRASEDDYSREGTTKDLMGGGTGRWAATRF